LSFKNDRQVFTANQFASAQSGTALDILKNIPSVSVNAVGDITLRGSNNFQLLVNGKPTQTDFSVLLTQLTANNIENIEIITSPSAKYYPDGKAGIINIITKKGISNGLVLMLNTMGGLPAIHQYDNSRKPSRYSGDFTIAYKKNKWELASSFNYLRNDAAGYREGNAFTYNNMVITLLPIQLLVLELFNKGLYDPTTKIIIRYDDEELFRAGYNTEDWIWTTSVRYHFSQGYNGDATTNKYLANILGTDDFISIIKWKLNIISIPAILRYTITYENFKQSNTNIKIC
jgi:hypothetical protein